MNKPTVIPSDIENVRQQYLAKAGEISLIATAVQPHELAEALENITSTGGQLSEADRAKLDGIEENANHYVHPDTHPADMIVQDESNRFVTDEQIAKWDNKPDTSEIFVGDIATYSYNGNLTGALKIILPTDISGNLSIQITGFDSKNGSWHLLLGGATLLPSSWAVASASSSGNVPNDMVRFGHDGARYCITLGDIASTWGSPSVIITNVKGSDQREGWSIAPVTSLTGITFSKEANPVKLPTIELIDIVRYANTGAQNSMVHPTWYNAVLKNGATGNIKYSNVNGMVCVLFTAVSVYPSTLHYPAVLPSGYRPRSNIGFLSAPTGYESAPYRIAIYTNGDIQIATMTQFTYPNIAFSAFQAYFAEQ